MTKVKLSNNEISTEFFLKYLHEFYPQGEFVLKDINPIYKYKDGKRTGTIIGYNYSLIDKTSFEYIRVKVSGSEPVIPLEDFQNQTIPVCVKLPKNTIVKPYKIQYGIVLVSILAPYIEVVKS